MKDQIPFKKGPTKRLSIQVDAVLLDRAKRLKIDLTAYLNWKIEEAVHQVEGQLLGEENHPLMQITNDGMLAGVLQTQLKAAGKMVLGE